MTGKYTKQESGETKKGDATLRHRDCVELMLPLGFGVLVRHLFSIFRQKKKQHSFLEQLTFCAVDDAEKSVAEFYTFVFSALATELGFFFDQQTTYFGGLSPGISHASICPSYQPYSI